MPSAVFGVTSNEETCENGISEGKTTSPDSDVSLPNSSLIITVTLSDFDPRTFCIHERGARQR
jgi:hypothetical protein